MRGGSPALLTELLFTIGIVKYLISLLYRGAIRQREHTSLTPGFLIKGKRMIYYGCPKCKTAMSSPDSQAGTEETCPNCGNVTTVPYPHSQPNVVVKTEKSSRVKTANGVGIAGLVLGIIACLGAWIPFYGAISLPVAILAFLFGLVGLIVSVVGRRSSA